MNWLNHIPLKHFQNKHLSAVLILLLVLSGCGNSKETTKRNVEKTPDRVVFKETFHEANSEKMIGHYEKAIELFEKCLSLESENAAVHFALSDLYEKQGDAAKTLSHAQQAYDLDETNKWYILRLADLYFKQEEYEKTASLYGKIIEDEKNIDLKFKYVEALIRSNQFEKAVDMLNEIEVETGKIPEISFTKYDMYRQLGDLEKGRLELENFMLDNPNNMDYKIMVAEFYLHEQQYARSQQIIQSVLDEDPNYGQAYIMLADLELRQNNVKGAFENLEKGFAHDGVPIDRKLEILYGLIPYAVPGERDHQEMKNGISRLFELIYDPGLKNAQLHDYYGYFNVTQKNYAKAREQYQLACDLDPSSYNAWLELLNVQYELKDYTGMVDNGTKAAELFPAQPMIYLLTGIGAKETKQYDKAEEWLFLGKDLVVKNPELSADFLYHLGDMNFRMGNPDEGEFYFEQAIQTYKGTIRVYVDRAKRLMNADKLDEAEAEIKKGLTVAPKSALALDTYGLILFYKKEYQAAVDTFTQALYGNYTNAEILEHYADAVYFNGEKDKAVELWGEAIKLGNASTVLLRKFNDKTYYAPE